MRASEDQIFQIVENVWTSFVGLRLQRRSLNALSGVRDRFLIASVDIDGAWEGTVAFSCSEDLARHVAAHLFDVTHDEVTREEIRETLAELCNIIGGNLKRIIPAPSRLSLPMVVSDRGHVVTQATLRQQTALRVLADCEKRLVLVIMADRTQSVPTNNR